MCIVEGHFQYSDETESAKFRFQEDALPILKKAREDGKVITEEVRHLMDDVMKHLPRKVLIKDGIAVFASTIESVLEKLEEMLGSLDRELRATNTHQTRSYHGVTNN